MISITTALDWNWDTTWDVLPTLLMTFLKVTLLVTVLSTLIAALLGLVIAMTLRLAPKPIAVTVKWIANFIRMKLAIHFTVTAMGFGASRRVMAMTRPRRAAINVLRTVTSKVTLRKVISSVGRTSQVVSQFQSRAVVIEIIKLLLPGWPSRARGSGPTST